LPGARFERGMCLPGVEHELNGEKYSMF